MDPTSPVKNPAAQQVEPSINIPEKRDIIEIHNEQSARVVYLQINKVENASYYQVEIQDRKKNTKQSYLIEVPEDHVRIKINPANYAIRTRSYDQRQRPGSWGKWGTFFVPFKAPTEIFPKKDETIIPASNDEHKLNLEWPKQESASAYRVQLFDENKKSLIDQVTAQNWLPIKLKIRSNYSWSVTPLTNPNEPEFKGKVESYPFVISQPREDLKLVKLKLKAKENAAKYQITLTSVTPGDVAKKTTQLDFADANFSARLAPGYYEIETRAVYADGSVSRWSKPSSFWVQLPPPEKITPVKSEIVDATDDEASEVRLEWKPVFGAEDYEIMITSADGQLLLKDRTKDSHYVTKMPHEANYFWKVKAFLPGEPSRLPASVDLPTEQFSIEKYIKLSLSGAEEPSQFFSWGKYITSSANYLSENYDNNNRVKENVLAGSGEFALGYWHRKSRFGAMLLGNISGIKIASTSAFYNGAGLLFGYRHILPDSKRWRLWVGPAYRQTPEITVNPYTYNIEIKNITNWGPQLVFTYLDAINEKWGYQAFANVYYGANSIETPNQLPQEKFLSYSASGFLTYKYTKTQTAMIGYTYQVDEAGYQTTDPVGTNNHVKFNGHYLSFSWVWGWQDPMK